MKLLTAALLSVLVGACVQADTSAAGDPSETARSPEELPVITEPARHDDGTLVEVEKTPEQWQEELTDKEYNVLREAGTERAFTGRYHDSKEDGVYTCAGCGLVLFDSQAKFDSGTGWPSFYKPVNDDFVATTTDSSYGMSRNENLCARCGGHLGHVFNDGPKTTGLRYCMNGYALRFVDRETYDKITQD